MARTADTPNFKLLNWNATQRRIPIDAKSIPYRVFLTSSGPTVGPMVSNRSSSTDTPSFSIPDFKFVLWTLDTWPSFKRSDPLAVVWTETTSIPSCFATWLILSTGIFLLSRYSIEVPPLNSTPIWSPHLIKLNIPDRITVPEIKR